MQTIKQTYLIHAPLKEVWEALVNPEYINNWGGGPAKMDSNIGTKFSLWDGTIWGKNIQVVPDKQLVQEWYSQEEKEWKKPSIVTFTLQEEKNGTQVDLLQTDVPDEDGKNIEEGWKEYYLGPLKKYLEEK